jgi:hypothetical protein
VLQCQKLQVCIPCRNYCNIYSKHIPYFLCTLLQLLAFLVLLLEGELLHLPHKKVLEEELLHLPHKVTPLLEVVLPHSREIPPAEALLLLRAVVGPLTAFLVVVGFCVLEVVVLEH